MSGSKVRHDVKVARVRFEWKIPGFPRRTGTLTSRVFPISAPEGVGRWRLELDTHYTYHYPLPDARSTLRSLFESDPADFACLARSDPNISVALRRQEGVQVRSTRATVTLLDDAGAAVGGGEAEELLLEGDRRSLAPRAAVLDRVKEQLTVVCEVEVEFLRPPAAAEAEQRRRRHQQQQRGGLAEDWSRLLASGSLSDVTVAVGGAELRAHRAVLAARSPVFAAMFRNRMLEEETGVVTVADVDADVFQAMLEFMYTDRVAEEMIRVRELLAAATKYQLEGLKVRCEEALREALSLDNVLENLAVADLYGAAGLMEDCVGLVAQHRARLLASPAWEDLKRSCQPLALRILEQLCLREQEYCFSDCSDEVLQA